VYRIEERLNRRLLELIVNIPPAEAEARNDAQINGLAIVA
jgi:hypothetical protein